MRTLRPVIKQLFTSFGLAAIILLAATINAGPVYAEYEQSVIPQNQQQLFSLDGYAPDQTLWAEKMKLRYEKAKITDERPLALLKIERLNVDAPVYHGTHWVTLDRGLGWVEGTAQPDEIGNIGLSGHRDSFFRALKDIELGDTIEMLTLKGVQDFRVSDISIVDALDVSVLDPTDTTVLTLITCHPFYYVGYAPDRYIVRATPVGGDGNNDSIHNATLPLASEMQ